MPLHVWRYQEPCLGRVTEDRDIVDQRLAAIYSYLAEMTRF